MGARERLSPSQSPCNVCLIVLQNPLATASSKAPLFHPTYLRSYVATSAVVQPILLGTYAPGEGDSHDKEFGERHRCAGVRHAHFGLPRCPTADGANTRSTSAAATPRGDSVCVQRRLGVLHVRSARRPGSDRSIQH